jgi:hypothetical protein
MSRELDLLARQFRSTPAKVIRAEANLYHSNIQAESAAFLRKIEQETKRVKTANVTLVAIIKSS